MYLYICVYMFGELCERCGCFLELHSIIASVVVLLNVLAGGRDHADGIRN